MDYQHLRNQLRNWLKNEIDIQLFCLFLEEKQISLNQPFDEFVLKLELKKEQLSEFKYQLEKFSKSEEQQITGVQNQESSKQKLKTYVDNTSVKHPQKQSILFSLQSSLVTFFTEQFRKNQKISHHQRQKQQNLKTKFEDFFNKLFKLMWKKNPQKALIQEMIRFATFQVVRSNRCFNNQDTKEKFQNMLEVSKSYKSLKIYGGHDFQFHRQKVFQKLRDQLVKMNTPTQVMSKFLEQIMDNPLSNCIANDNSLSCKAKKDFYDSLFYKNNLLIQYAELRFYPQSLHSKARNEISSIIKLIQQSVLINPAIVTSTFTFDLIGLLKIPNMNPIKKDIFNHIKNKCPNYYKVCMLVRYQEKNIQQIRFDSTIKLRFDLRALFLQIGLKFQQWQKTEDQLMSKTQTQSIIHKLQLNLEQKQKLRRFYFQQIQTYFHNQQKPLKYYQQAEECLFGEILNSNIEPEKNMMIIQKLIKEIIQYMNITGPLVQEQLTPKRKKDLKDLLDNSVFYKQFAKNKGIDIKEEEYLAKLKIKKQLYEKSAQDQFQYSYSYIEKQVNLYYKQKPQDKLGIIVKSFIAENQQNKTPLSIPSSPVKNGRAEISAFKNKESQKIQNGQNLGSKPQLINRLQTILQKECYKQSIITEIKKSKFQHREFEYYELLIQVNPLENQAIQGEKFNINKILTRKLNQQWQVLVKNNKEVSQIIYQYSLPDISIQSQDPPRVNREIQQAVYDQKPNEEQLLLERFYKHIQEKQSKMLLKIINENYGGKYDEFLRKVLINNYFVDVDQQKILSQCCITKIQYKIIKKQLQKLSRSYIQEYNSINR